MSVLSVETFREAMPSQLSLFDMPPTHTEEENVYFQDVRPISQISDSSPIEFQLSAQNGMDYIDLKRTRIYVKLKVMNGVQFGKALTETVTAIVWGQYSGLFEINQARDIIMN